MNFLKQVVAGVVAEMKQVNAVFSGELHRNEVMQAKLELCKEINSLMLQLEAKDAAIAALLKGQAA